MTRSTVSASDSSTTRTKTKHKFRSRKTKRAKLVRVYFMTVTTPSWYNEAAGIARAIEVHYVATRQGEMYQNRLILKKIGIRNFQQAFQQRYGFKISSSQVKARFEREQRGVSSSPIVKAQPIEFTYKGPSQRAQRLPPFVIRLRRRRRHMQPKKRQRRSQHRRSQTHRRKLERRKRTKVHRGGKCSKQ